MFDSFRPLGERYKKRRQMSDVVTKAGQLSDIIGVFVCHGWIRSFVPLVVSFLATSRNRTTSFISHERTRMRSRSRREMLTATSTVHTYVCTYDKFFSVLGDLPLLGNRVSQNDCHEPLAPSKLSS